jgi:hypothetical protein
MQPQTTSAIIAARKIPNPSRFSLSPAELVGRLERRVIWQCCRKIGPRCQIATWCSLGVAAVTADGQILRTPKPLGVKLYEDNFSSEQAAKPPSSQAKRRYTPFWKA